MRRIYYTPEKPIDDFHIKSITLDDNSIRITVEKSVDTDVEDIVIVITKESLKETLGAKDIQDHTIVTVYYDEDEKIHMLNRYKISGNTKVNGHVYWKNFSPRPFMELFIPFKSFNISDLSFRILKLGDIKDMVDTNKAQTIVLPAELKKHGVILGGEMPSIVVTSIINDGSYFTINGNITLRGEAVGVSGVSIYADSNEGYIPYRKVKTDASGAFKVKVCKLHMDSSDMMKVKLGFKDYRNKETVYV